MHARSAPHSCTTSDELICRAHYRRVVVAPAPNPQRLYRNRWNDRHGRVTCPTGPEASVVGAVQSDGDAPLCVTELQRLPLCLCVRSIGRRPVASGPSLASPNVHSRRDCACCMHANPDRLPHMFTLNGKFTAALDSNVTSSHASMSAPFGTLRNALPRSQAC